MDEIERLLEIIELIVDEDDGESWREKSLRIVDAVKRRKCEAEFAEFLSWFDE